MSSALDKLKGWLGRRKDEARDVAEGGRPVTTPAAGTGDSERETSTNAQVEGAAGEAWPGNE